MVGGRYRLGERLGTGGFGQVWLARDETLRIDVAVKAVSIPPSASDEEQRQRLVRAEREARNAARLRDHPNVVSVHDVVVDGGVPWIIMQLVEGLSLQERLDASGPLSVEATASIASALLEALGAAHAAGIQHRDVKPANVMLTGDGRILLADFGIAVHHDDTALTGAGLLIGSVEYIAPERVRGNGRTISDLFSLGVTLYQAVEGFSPFRREAAGDALSAVLFDDPPEPQRAGALTQLIARLLVKDPDRRATVQEAKDLLETVAAGSAGHAPKLDAPTRLPATTPADAQRRRRAIGALAAAEHAARACEDEDDRARLIAGAARVWAGIDPARALALADEAERSARAISLKDGPVERYAIAPEVQLKILAEVAGSLAALDVGRARRLLDEAESLLDQIGDDDDSVSAREDGLFFLASAALTADPERGGRLADELEGLLRADADGAELAEELEILAAQWRDVAPDRARTLAAEAARLIATAEPTAPHIPAPKTAGRTVATAEGSTAAREAERTARALPAGRDRALALLHAARLLAPADPERAQQLTADADGDITRVAFNWRRARLYQEVRSTRVEIAGAWTVTDPERAVALLETVTADLTDGSTHDDANQIWCEAAVVLAGAAEMHAADDGDRALALAACGVSMARRISPVHAPGYAALAALGRALVYTAWWFVHRAERAVINSTGLDRVEKLLADTERALTLLSEHMAAHPQLWVVEGMDGVPVKEAQVRAQIAEAAVDVVSRTAVVNPGGSMQVLPHAERLIPGGDDHHGLTMARWALIRCLTLAGSRAAATEPQLSHRLFENAQRLALDLGQDHGEHWLTADTAKAQAQTDLDGAERTARTIPQGSDRAEAWLAIAQAWLRPAAT
ncbi:serine/threonine-protein kinase [Streptomyces sp. NPDC006743]|uniref:serine/threonine-protein kinase n=1 Tax=Streptomyces sp. NPDC006743 TaxID=3154480 RepID=UPI003456CF73